MINVRWTRETLSLFKLSCEISSLLIYQLWCFARVVFTLRRSGTKVSRGLKILNFLDDFEFYCRLRFKFGFDRGDWAFVVQVHLLALKCSCNRTIGFPRALPLHCWSTKISSKRKSERISAWTGIVDQLRLWPFDRSIENKALIIQSTLMEYAAQNE